MLNVSPENSLPLSRNHKKARKIHSVMTSFHYQLPFKIRPISYGFSQLYDTDMEVYGFVRTLIGLLTSYEVSRILIWSKLGH